MALNVSFDTAVGAAGAAAFLAVGLLLLVSRGGGAMRVIFASTCLAYGLCYIVLNLSSYRTMGDYYAIWALHAVTVAASAAFVIALARSLSPRRRVLLGVLALLALGSLVHFVATWDIEAGVRAHDPQGPSAPGRGRLILITWAVAWSIPLAFVLVCAAAALGPANVRPRGAALLAIAFASPLALNSFRLAPYGLTGPVFAVLTLLVALLWLPRPSAPEPRWRLAVVFTILGLTLGGQILFLVATRSGVQVGNDLGSNGVVRTAAALLVALAILRERVFDIEPPRFAVRRGPLAAAALAALFIVAQIAQNFFEAEYGLLMGGVVAGAFLFAASPIQGFIERAAAPRDGRASEGAIRETVGVAGAGKEEAYRNALRLALRDRILTDEEEVHLAHLSDELGLTHKRAREIRNEVRRDVGRR